MTALSDPTEWTDPDLVPRTLITIGAAGIDVSSLDTHGLDRLETDFHRHRKGQLLLLLRGVLTCEVAGGLWIVPPGSALWMPGDTLHNVTAAGTIEVYIAFIATDVSHGLQASCCAITATPLLRELVIRSATLPVLYAEGGFEARLITLLLDELAAAPIGNLHLPMPTHPRLRSIAETIIDEPADRRTIQSWALRVGMSERTLARVLARETGMSFGRWRRQLHLLLAVKWLATGTAVQQIAENLGYESAGSFVTMFRKAMGTSPGRFVTERSSVSGGEV